jgi:L-aspartate oxidase
MTITLPHRSAGGHIPPLTLNALQHLAWDKVGIVRNGDDLLAAALVLAAWSNSLPKPANRTVHEFSNLLTVARLMTEAAIVREESRGAHYRTSYPHTSPQWERHITLVKESA